MATSLPPAPAAFASALQGGGSNVASLISSGNFAASLASKAGALSSLPTSLSGLAPSLPTLPSMPAIPSLSSPLGSPTGRPSEDALSAAAAAPTAPPDSVKGVAAQAFGAVTASFKPFTPGVPQDLKAIAEKNAATQAAGEAARAAPAAAQANTPEIKQLTSSLGGMVDPKALISGANLGNLSAGASSLTSNLGASLPSISSSVGSIAGVTSNPLTSTASSLLPSSASSILSSAKTGTGISGLPGGMSSVASIVNNAPGSSPSPSAALSGITAGLKNTSTGALNGISSLTAGSSLTTSLSAGPSGISDAVNKLKGTSSLPAGLDTSKQGLASLASAGLPASAAAALESNINSLNSSGPQPIKMPTIASNTVDRSEVTSQINSQLGDSKIPAPDFSGAGPTADAKSAQDSAATRKSEFLAAKQAYKTELDARTAAIMKEGDAYKELKNTLPQGDPQIRAAKATGDANWKEYQAWSKAELAKLDAMYYNL